MIAGELGHIIRHVFGLPPTPEQEAAIDTFCRFMTDGRRDPVMIMRGAAGTGKTSLAAAFVKSMLHIGQKVMLLAPTGRAAKVLSVSAGHPAFTIHRKIYRQSRFTGEMSGFKLGDNMFSDTLFLVDEASMIANDGQYDNAAFGTGRLLDDLVSFVYGGRNCRMLLVGDKAQLPPIGEEESPALSADYMAGYGLEVYQCDLDEVLRQSAGSGILYNATAIRRMITHDEATRLPVIKLSGFADIVSVPGSELVDQLGTSYRQVGEDETMVVTRSNKRANIFNAGIRSMVLGIDEELVTGDIIMVVRNNYYWTENDKESKLSFIANGDRAFVQRVRNIREFYGFHFADVCMRFPDYDNYELTVTVLTDSIRSESPSLTREQGEKLFNAIMEDYQDVPLKADRLKKIKQDPYYNAVQIKYAYAVTCHKAQGGQWAHVYLDQGYMTADMLTPDYIHWLYTAFTRATEKLFLVNWPHEQTSD